MVQHLGEVKDALLRLADQAPTLHSLTEHSNSSSQVTKILLATPDASLPSTLSSERRELLLGYRKNVLSGAVDLIGAIPNCRMKVSESNSSSYDLKFLQSARDSFRASADINESAVLFWDSTHGQQYLEASRKKGSEWKVRMMDDGVGAAARIFVLSRKQISEIADRDGIRSVAAVALQEAHNQEEARIDVRCVLRESLSSELRSEELDILVVDDELASLTDTTQSHSTISHISVVWGEDELEEIRRRWEQMWSNGKALSDFLASENIPPEYVQRAENLSTDAKEFIERCVKSQISRTSKSSIIQPTTTAYRRSVQDWIEATLTSQKLMQYRAISPEFRHALRVRVGDGHEIAVCRLETLDGRPEPTALVTASTRSLDETNVRNEARVAAIQGTKLNEASTVLAFRPHSHESTPGDIYKSIYAGQLGTIAGYETSAAVQIESKKAVDLSWYSEYADTYKKMHDADAEMKRTVRVEPREMMKRYLEFGFIDLIHVEGEFAGVVAGAFENFFGIYGVLVHERVLWPKFQGKKLGAAMQMVVARRLVEDLGEELLVYGYVAHRNIRSSRSAMSVGRERVGDLIRL